MKAILINPETQSISEIEIEDGIQPIYDAIDADTFDVARIDEINAVYVDDMGLCKKNSYFMLGELRVLAGKGLILGTDYNTGESISTTLTVEEVTQMTTFLSTGGALAMARAQDAQALENQHDFLFVVEIAPLIESAWQD